MSDEEASEGEYEVECILAARVVDPTIADARGGDNWEYKVRWYNFDEKSDTWEPHSSLEMHCQTNIRRFWDHVGTDDHDYEPGYKVRAKGSWIKQQHEQLVREKKREARKRRGNSGDEESDIEIAATPRRTQTPEEPIKVKKEGDKRGRAKSKEDGSRERARSIRRKQAQLREEAAEKRKARDHSKRGRSVEKSTETKPAVKGGSTVKRSESRKPPRKHQIINSDSSDMDDVPLAQISKGKAKSSNNSVAKPVAPTQAKDQKPKSRPVSPASSHDSLFGSPTKSPPKPPPTRAKRTGGDPRRGIRIMDDPVSAPTGAVPISAKQRIYEQARGRDKTAPLDKEPSLSNLKFGKLSLQNTPSPATPQQTTPLQAEQPMEIDHDVPMTPPMEDDMPVNLPDVQMSTNNVDSFLANLPIQSVSAATDQRKSSASGFGSMSKIPKKWSWYGECLITTQDTLHKRRCCDVAVVEEPDSTIIFKGLQLGFLLKPAAESHLGSALHLQKLVPCSQVALHLHAYASRSQLVRIGPKEDIDNTPLSQIAMFMLRTSSVSIVPLISVVDGKKDENLGIMIVFPPSNTALCTSLKISHGIPDHMRRNGHDTAYLLGAVYPNKLIDSRYMDIQAPMVTKTYPPQTPPISATPAQLPSKYLRAKHANVYRAHLLLRFPQRYVAMFARKDRKAMTYCTWTLHDLDPLVVPTLDLETRALRCIMRHYEIKDVGHKKDVDFVFVHVGALRTIYRLLALYERRARRPEISFVLYGTHLSAPPKRWGIREFWPMGGVITFTPSVLANHPVEVAEMIRKAHTNPLWLCCLVPSALGAAIAVGYPESDDMELTKSIARNNLADILKVIEERMVSVFQLPNRVNSATDITFEDEFTWIHEQLQSADRDTEQLLDFCLRIYNQIPKAVPHNPEILEKAIRYDITNYLRDLQTRPPLMKSYRRYVVIGEEEENNGYPQIGWCEFATFATFKGRDELWNPTPASTAPAPKPDAGDPTPGAQDSALDAQDPSPADWGAQQQNTWQSTWS